MFNPHPDRIVVSLDKTVYDDYLGLVTSNKQQIQWTRIRGIPQEHWITVRRAYSVADSVADSSKLKVVTVMKSVQIV